MIPPDKLTEKNGFVEGCVVETIERGTRRFNILNRIGHVVEPPADYWFLEFSDGWRPIIGLFDSIRPLTGPMAIWNFIPRNVKAIVLSNDGWPVSMYYYNMPDIMLPRGVIERPWWATAQRREE